MNCSQTIQQQRLTFTTLGTLPSFLTSSGSSRACDRGRSTPHCDSSHTVHCSDRMDRRCRPPKNIPPNLESPGSSNGWSPNHNRFCRCNASRSIQVSAAPRWPPQSQVSARRRASVSLPPPFGNLRALTSLPTRVPAVLAALEHAPIVRAAGQSILRLGTTRGLDREHPCRKSRRFSRGAAAPFETPAAGARLASRDVLLRVLVGFRTDTTCEEG